MKDPWLIALDVDGTVLRQDGSVGESTVQQVARLTKLGHEVTLATGRSVTTTLPVLEQLKISPRYVVCSNGAITLKKDPAQPSGYARAYIETFDPSEVLRTVRASLEGANFAVEDESGMFRFTGMFPDGALGFARELVTFEELFSRPATRVVVVSPEHAVEDFLSVVEKLGLHRVSYNVGWTAWLDIAPDGVNKSTALERVRNLLDIPRSRVIAIGDGRNDIDMLAWASEEGRGVAMGQSPPEVIQAASETTTSDLDDGVAAFLATL
jgi:5-amino-6-(5-phospho-D-ribitylamino)uracil phosphatase